MKNKEKANISPWKRLSRYLATLLGSCAAFFGTVSLTTGSTRPLTLTVAYTVILFLAFTAFISAGMLRKTERRIASKAVYCATVLFNGVAGGLLAALVYVWRSAVPGVTEILSCAVGCAAIPALTAILTALIRRRGAVYASCALTLAALIWVVKRIVDTDARDAFYILAVLSLVFIAFRLLTCLFILSDKSYFRHDALLSFGVAIAVGAIALVIFSDGAPAQTMIEVEGTSDKRKK